MSASAGRVLLLPKGTYNASVTYHLLDIVEYNNATYVCKQTTTGNLPTNTTYWQKMVEGGVTSFNGRSGSVSPQSGDYTAAMVGLGNVDNTSDLNKPISTATQTALNGKADESALTDGSVTKIGTGNVGSATQPVYINGGVPTAIGTLGIANGGTGDTKGRAVGSYIPATSDADVDMSAMSNYARASRVDVVDSGHLPTSNWYLVNTLHGGATGSDYGVQLALQMTGTNDIVAYRRYISGAWTDWKYLTRVTMLITVASSGWTAESYTSPSGTVYAYKKEVSITLMTADSYVDGDISSGTYTSAWCVESASGKAVIRTVTQPSSSLTFRLYYQI